MVHGNNRLFFANMKMDVITTKNIMQEQLYDLPQEIVYEIISYVPEYGHRVSHELHDRSLSTQKISAYCDFYRYCVRSIAGPLDTCIDIVCETLPGDVTDRALKYLHRNIRGLLFNYLHDQYIYYENNIGPIICEILSNFGITNVKRLTYIYNVHRGERDSPYSGIRWCKKYIDFYVTMILYDNDIITKKEFDRHMSRVTDIRAILQSIILLQCIQDHISCLAIRYFGHIIPEMCLEADTYINAHDYRYYETYDKFIKVIESPFYNHVPIGDTIDERIEHLAALVPEDTTIFTPDTRDIYLIEARRQLAKE